MISRMVPAAAFALAALLAQPAAAGSVSFGVHADGVGVSIHSGWHPGWGHRYRPYGRAYPPPAYYAPAPPAFYPPPMLTADGIVHALHGHGYSQVAIMGQRGDVYLVRAHDPWNNVVEVEVWAGDGRIVSGRVLEPPASALPGAPAPGSARASAPAPAPVARSAASASWTAPLPRRRPALDIHPEEEPLFSRPDEETPEGRDPLVVY